MIFNGKKICFECSGKGSVRTTYPFPIKCEWCNGSGAIDRDIVSVQTFEKVPDAVVYPKCKDSEISSVKSFGLPKEDMLDKSCFEVSGYKEDVPEGKIVVYKRRPGRPGKNGSFLVRKLVTVAQKRPVGRPRKVVNV